MQRRKKTARPEQKKGFTLVELIVVLVILAILAAFLVPALTGYIDRAKEKKALAHARLFMNAVQSIAVEDYAAGNAYVEGAEHKTTYEAISNTQPRPSAATGKARIRAIYDLMDPTSISEKFYAIALVEKGVLTKVGYKDADDQVIWEWTRQTQQWEKRTYDDTDAWALNDYARKAVSTDSKVWWNGY
jgi:prepilin-type N-terminal cleavage/methylation domain-containing protein